MIVLQKISGKRGKDIDGNIHNVYVMDNRTTDRDFWESQ